VDQIEPALVNEILTVSGVIHNLFSEKIVGTIQSGLPSMVEIEVKLLDAEGRTKLRRRYLRTISYDIWQERYTVRREDTTVVSGDFEAVKRLTSRLEHVVLAPKTVLDARTRYAIALRVRVIPISVRQGQKVLDWLREPNQTEEDLASEDRSSGFRLNLSKLVSFFVGGNKRRQNRSPWYSSRMFRLSDL
jgi:hypothetical protein